MLYVYLLINSCDEIVGAFSSMEKAEKYLDKRMKDNGDTLVSRETIWECLYAYRIKGSWGVERTEYIKILDVDLKA